MLAPKFGGRTDLPACSDCGLGGLAVYQGVVQNNPELISACRSDVMQFGPNALVIRQDQIPKVIYTVYSGWLYRYRKLTNGRQQIMSFAIPGDVIPFISMFSPQTPIFYGVKSVTKVQLCAFDCGAFRQRIGSHPAFMGPFQMAVGQYMDALHRRLADMGQRSANGRLAQLLIELFQRHERRGMAVDGVFEFPVSQQLLAKALGLTKAYVNRTLSSLKSNGLIQLQDRRLEILDLDGLKDVAENE